MKSLILILHFCAGFNEGRRDAYCRYSSYCVEPKPVICPIPGPSEEGYLDGYHRGFNEANYFILMGHK